MVGIIIHLMFEIPSISLYLITFSRHWGSGHLQVNELLTSELESLWPAYTLQDQSLKSLIMAKNNNVSM